MAKEIGPLHHDINGDYKIWLVINPSTWLVPIWIALLALVVVIHVAVIGGGKFNFLAAPVAVAAAK